MEAIVGLLSTILVPGAPHGDKHVGVLSYVNGSVLQHHPHLVVRSVSFWSKNLLELEATDQ
jgi:hypothetical protein